MPVAASKAPIVAIVGGGPAGLMAAEILAAGGARVELFDAMPSLGRKFLMAGKGGMNITHAEPMATFLTRYGSRRPWLEQALADFGPEQIRIWMAGLGIDSFVGSSGRVFPLGMKAAPLLRAWLHRLRLGGVVFHVRHRWLGWSGEGALRFATPAGEREHLATAVVLALGGGSWARLGSDGAWVPLLRARGVPVAGLRPANCGFEVAWSEFFRTRYAGCPLKPVVVSFAGDSRQGECMLTEHGIEGGPIYAFSGALRESLAAGGATEIELDLVPGRSLDRLRAELGRPRGRDSLANHLRRRAAVEGAKAALLRECAAPEALADGSRLAELLKALPLRLRAPRPLDEAISSAGGVEFEGLDGALMAQNLPGVFCAGEMLDWEAPTGGYLLTACLATGRAAGRSALHWLGLE